MAIITTYPDDSATTDSDKFLTSDSSGATKLTTGATLKNYIGTNIPITTALVDINGNELIKVTPTTSAVNEFSVANAATGNSPSITASGGDTNIGINLVPKGTGKVQINGSAIEVTPTTYTNPGSAGGTNTFFYKSVAGRKYFWGQTAQINITGSGFQVTAADVTFPASYFSTIESVVISSGPVGATVFQSCSLNSVSTTGLSIYAWQGSGTNGNQKVNVFVVGT